MQNKLLVFGGSFDPPHVGHMNLLKNAVAAVKPDKVLVIPSGMSPHKKASETDFALRAAMCECFRPVFPSLCVSDMENKREGKSYTYDTLLALKADYEAHDIYLCIGGDMLESFMTWHRWQDILDLAVLVVTGRTQPPSGHLEKNANTLCQQGGRVLFADGPVVPASSSDIRRRVAQGKSVKGLVPPPADDIVKREKLYLVK